MNKYLHVTASSSLPAKFLAGVNLSGEYGLLSYQN